ncbi:hypothetical protein A2U01_0036711 [Trifolium medium]|uniref:Uncharacterized protein n=1 Tax=Trifolium medium TaxID=97028 RepID=A0A392PU07_9FABA|nr:hypothetical protein [Trifolium medium]
MVNRFRSWDEVWIFCIHISEKSVALTKSCCPRLESFKLNNQGYRCPRKGFDEDALEDAICSSLEIGLQVMDCWPFLKTVLILNLLIYISVSMLLTLDLI